MDYLDKYKSKDEKRKSVLDILRLDASTDWDTIKQKYSATAFNADGTIAIDIDHVKIGGNTYTNYGQFQFMLEKSYDKQPSRSQGGVISNLNAHPTFVVAHLIMNFSVMSIDDYRSIVKMDLEQNEFMVECYNPIYNTKFKGKMYFAPPEMAKLLTLQRRRWNTQDWEEYSLLYGVQDYTVELIGTNADPELVSVTYHLNPPADAGKNDYPLAEDDVYRGEDVIIGNAASAITSETFGGTYKFTKWNTSSENPTTPKEKGNYLNGYAYTINDPLVLYAQWEATTDHTLSFNYGLADPTINDENFTYENSRTVSFGKSIGTLPVAKTPVVKVKFGDETREYTPYSNPQWWKTPQKVQKYDPNSGEDITYTLILRNNDPYWLERDGTAYLLFDTAKYLLELHIWNGTEFERYSSNSVEFNTPMNLPYPVRNGYKFDGWYLSPDMTGTKASGNMPPYPMALFGKWIEEK